MMLKQQRQEHQQRILTAAQVPAALLLAESLLSQGQYEQALNVLKKIMQQVHVVFYLNINIDIFSVCY